MKAYVVAQGHYDERLSRNHLVFASEDERYMYSYHFRYKINMFKYEKEIELNGSSLSGSNVNNYCDNRPVKEIFNLTDPTITYDDAATTTSANSLTIASLNFEEAKTKVIPYRTYKGGWVNYTSASDYFEDTAGVFDELKAVIAPVLERVSRREDCQQQWSSNSAAPASNITMENGNTLSNTDMIRRVAISFLELEPGNVITKVMGNMPRPAMRSTLNGSYTFGYDHNEYNYNTATQELDDSCSAKMAVNAIETTYLIQQEAAEGEILSLMEIYLKETDFVLAAKRVLLGSWMKKLITMVDNHLTS